MKKLAKTLVTAAILLIISSINYTLQAQEVSVCREHNIVIKTLRSEFNEGQAAIGLASNGHILEIFSTKNGSTWTIMLTKPSGETCLLVAGEHLELLEDLTGIKISYPVK